ncbi:STAS-like domain-containing protein [Ectopseudomonas khazarica]|uniref:STAS-like domain-containing protein n=1 Tax=Ectopseudomonas khazarica TaxID=2502979 RepID=UPI00106E7CE6|nr:STAS-like domain-containing protein [Pseudomonas khazarica]QTS85250.1 STAS-like domain-containing protein [Pseudomonas khazarica]
MKGKIIEVKNTCPYPGGRYRQHGSGSGEEFRDDVLQPALENERLVTLDFSGIYGMGESFLEEVFGGLVRIHGHSEQELMARLNVIADTDTERSLIVNSIKSYTKLP